MSNPALSNIFWQLRQASGPTKLLEAGMAYIINSNDYQHSAIQTDVEEVQTDKRNILQLIIFSYVTTIFIQGNKNTIGPCVIYLITFSLSLSGDKTKIYS